MLTLSEYHLFCVNHTSVKLILKTWRRVSCFCVQVLHSSCSAEKVTVVIKHNNEAIHQGVSCSASVGLCPES